MPLIACVCLKEEMIACFRFRRCECLKLDAVIRAIAKRKHKTFGYINDTEKKRKIELVCDVCVLRVYAQAHACLCVCEP